MGASTQARELLLSADSITEVLRELIIKGEIDIGVQLNRDFRYALSQPFGILVGIGEIVRAGGIVAGKLKYEISRSLISLEYLALPALHQHAAASA